MPRAGRQRELAVRLAIVALAVLGILAVSLDYLARSRAVAPPMVTATAALRLPTSADVEGETVTAEEGDAGASWADSHALTRATDCPNYTKAFRFGCAQEIADRARLPSTPSH